MKALISAAAFVAALTASVVPASAQEAGAIALDQLDLTPAGDPFFGVPSPFIGGHLVPRGYAVFSHAGSPLTLSEGDTERAVVAGQSILHLGASFSLFDRAQISLQVPLALAQSGDGAPSTQDVAEAIPEGPALGDPRIGARIRLIGEERGIFQLGTGFALHIPVGASDNYMSDGSVRVTPQLLLGGRFRDLLVWSVSGGAMIRSSGNPSTLTYGAGVAVLLLDERLQVGPEIYAATPLQGGSLGLSESTRVEHARATRAEVLLDARAWLWSGLTVGAAGGPGLGDGIGTPAFRVLGTVAWSPRAENPEVEAKASADTDGDGLRDGEDACPYAHGPRSADPKHNGCPVADRDEDGIADGEDACVDEAGVASADPKRRGCPADGDGDGVPDTIDACPAEAGPAESVGGRAGCPAPPPVLDRDGDGINDKDDACPGEKGVASDDATARGCPKLVRVRGDEVVVLEPVSFRVSTALLPPIEAKSLPALEELKEVLLQHPEWVKIEVQAHTDNSGNAKYNETLSTSRAESVKKWLVDKGIAADRLVAKGYGGSTPIADNATAAGREKNRRVQLLVLEKKSP
ncbi:OmpA family protein [Chondromyces apiculatus]|uniref:OmpA domain protein n=1 Tax=Chondromyces apiculatus DSM 436 TaxID=1192034 RepID=A0A017TAK7_9BACT|nr:OmpA family protein [Chondromyces apiculatus]EYF06318.1 OmpA domain protein [Chondromyces apiculatus DSM 436]